MTGTAASLDGRHPRAWLFTIMRHAWINENRKLKPIPVLDPELIGISQPRKASTWGKPEDALAHKIMDPRLEAASTISRAITGRS